MYEIDYVNETEFKRLEHGLRKFNMIAYKEYAFKYRPKLLAGDFSDAVLNGNVYEIYLYTDKIFEKVYGLCKLRFQVINKTVVLLEITPKDILFEGHISELITYYKGIMISKENASKDMFKIDLLNMLDDWKH